MFRHRQSLVAVAVAAVVSVFLVAGCNARGEETVAEKDFATSSTVKTAIGAAGSRRSLKPTESTAMIRPPCVGAPISGSMAESGLTRALLDATDGSCVASI